ncbi:regulatory protein, tetR family [Actinokineospora alba]|uniref:Regulatory protein, tetR family n=1 Tax=Actinokineospora alba TaxID=504798 RepID=A0A1H0VLP9_9PSEU|nr:TetR/AcrR family transcriptional regulator [Actinokineospora alba]TDP67634.1 TetR family transcriptional regulator [Actinokineospora alba]SDJ29538.1 regulatory protein, tetR family [Actinokineospora alba]SDP79293.1 regulatory protein, tetR family [Actinokineospora alba]
MTTTPQRRAAIADAAIATLAAEGMRGLTHRAVDRRAGLPEGSSSYYFRTRQALLEATVQRLSTLDDQMVAPMSAKPRVEDLPDLLTGMIEFSVTTGRDWAIARYELSLEATRRPELRAVLLAVGKRYRDLAVAMLTEAGASDPERQGQDLVAYADGLIFDTVAGAGGREFDRAGVRKSVVELLDQAIPGFRS